MKIFQKSILLSIAISLLIVSITTQSPDQDQVQVPVPNYNHKFYSGYFDIDIFKTEKSVHYLFFQSQNDVSKDPLVVWFSGGPGCSSLLGAFHENGPFIFYPGQHNFKLNNNSWNKQANLLYLELPVGVGFSTSANESQLVTDAIFVDQAAAVLTHFYQRFQKMKKNELYLTGHGFASVYITHLAKYIIDQNNDPFPIFIDKVNLKGILMGNPCVKPDQCYASGSQRSSHYHYEFLYKRGFYALAEYERYQQQCAFAQNSYACYQQRMIMDAKFNATNTSQYNIYDKCYRGKNDSSNLKYVNTGCEDEAGLMTYLNDPQVQQNWNIRDTREWKPCNNKVFAAYLSSGKNCYFLLPELIKSHLRIWIYSGDLDSKVPITSTTKWVRQLKDQLQLPILKNWRQWWVPGKHKGEDQVGGYIWEIEGFTFVSVKGAGLRTGLDQPQAMSELLDGFLSGKTLPYKQF